MRDDEHDPLCGGRESEIVNIPFLNNGLKEANETFSLTLSNATGYPVGNRNRPVSILNVSPEVPTCGAVVGRRSRFGGRNR